MQWSFRYGIRESVRCGRLGVLSIWPSRCVGDNQLSAKECISGLERDTSLGLVWTSTNINYLGSLYISFYTLYYS